MAAKDLGPLDWRTPIVDGAGRPSPEFQRRWNTQRNNNGLIGFVTTGSGAPTGTPADGQEYVDISATPWALYVGNAGAWTRVGVFDFTQLADVPHAYTGEGGSVVRVNAGATGLDFITLTGLLDTISSTEGAVLYRGPTAWQALAPGTAGDVLSTNGAGAAPTWIPQSGGGGSTNSGLFKGPIISSNAGNGGPANVYVAVWMNVGDVVTGVAFIPRSTGSMSMGSALYTSDNVGNLLASSNIGSISYTANQLTKIPFTSPYTVTSAGFYYSTLYQGSSLTMATFNNSSGTYTTGTLTSFPSTGPGVAGGCQSSNIPYT